MSDILIRDVDASLKREIETRAKKHGRSLSAEIKALLRRAVVSDTEEDTRTGLALVEVFRRHGANIDLEIPRSDPIRDPPDFS